MQLNPIYRVRFEYPQQSDADIKGTNGIEEQMFLLADGEAEGDVAELIWEPSPSG